MTPIDAKNILFDTEVGKVEVIHHENGWVFEFTSGYNKGLYCDGSFATFDKCYSHIKGRMKEWVVQMKEEEFSKFLDRCEKGHP